VSDGIALAPQPGVSITAVQSGSRWKPVGPTEDESQMLVGLESSGQGAWLWCWQVVVLLEETYKQLVLNAVQIQFSVQWRCRHCENKAFLLERKTDFQEAYISIYIRRITVKMSFLYIVYKLYIYFNQGKSFLSILNPLFVHSSSKHFENCVDTSNERMISHLVRYWFGNISRRQDIGLYWLFFLDSLSSVGAIRLFFLFLQRFLRNVIK